MGGRILPVFGGVGGPAFVAADCDDEGRTSLTGEEGGRARREENPRESGSGEDGGDTRSFVVPKIGGNIACLSALSCSFPGMFELDLKMGTSKSTCS